jgi:adenylylsulfate kinase
LKKTTNTKGKKTNPTKRTRTRTSKPKKIPIQGGVIWLTGLSGAGKSTLSQMVGPALRERGCKIEVLDGDVIRTNLSKGLGFSRDDRNTNIRRIGFVSNLLARNGVWVLVAAISPYRAIRQDVRENVVRDGAKFVEVFITCPLDVLEERDPKGLYKKARSGKLTGFTGISDPYEEPTTPEIIIHSNKETPEESARQILNYLYSLGL